MPLVLHQSMPLWGDLYIWHVREEQRFFEVELEKAGLGLDHLRKWHPSRQLEWLSGRYLIHQYLHEEVSALHIDAHGKPGWPKSDSHISLSHSGGLVGLQVLGINHGLDIQLTTDKVSRVAHKFCSDHDRSVLSTIYSKQDTEHYIWGLKECVFKAYGKGQLSYLDHIHILSVMPKGRVHFVELRLTKDGVTINYRGKLSRLGPYYITQVVELR